MRMWMVNPRIMCRQHLLGEHLEIHMFAGTIREKKSLVGYVENNLFEAGSLKVRHDRLVKEMVRRGYDHKSVLRKPNMKYLSKYERKSKVDKEKSLDDLICRCTECRRNYRKGK